MIAFRSGSNDRFAVSSSMSLISNATIARPATDLGPGGAHGCAYGRCLVSLGGPRRAALVGGSTAGRLCDGRQLQSRRPLLCGGRSAHGVDALGAVAAGSGSPY